MYPGKWSRQFPDKPAAIDASTDERVSYRELDQRSIQLARFFQAKGLRPGDHVAVFLPNDLRYFEVVWAAFRTGLYLTTINRYLTGEEAGYIVDDCEAKVLVTSNRLADVAVELRRFAPNCATWLMIGAACDGYDAYESAFASYATDPLEDEPAGQFMLYSSGTTGRPKGIVRPPFQHQIWEESGPVGELQRTLWGFGETTIYLSPAPLYHSAPIAFCIAAQASGGTVVMLPRFDETAALQAIETYQVTHSQWVPTMFTRMLRLPEDVRNNFDLSSHRFAIHAAAPCPPGIKRQMFDWWGPNIYEYYAGTELNGFTHATPQDWLNHPGTVGKALLGVVRICDDNGDELPTGEPGIVYFELPEMPFSYHNDPVKTQATQHPRHPNWSALGDVGYLDEEGFLYLTDRASHMIISGGVNIYPQEIEDTLVLHPQVADVAVIGVPNEEMGEEVKAVVQLTQGTKPNEALAETLLAFVRDHIAHYKCPRSVDFVASLPRLPTGKLYKRLIKDPYWGKTDSRIV